ncbi:MAG: YdcF family protein [Lachnospiraceae bacterium]|nr:YdcF family protein [Lachnospiraceae bacterium]
MKKVSHIVLKILFIILGLFILVIGLYASTVCNMNAGLIVNIMLGMVTLAYGLFYKVLVKKLPRWLIGIYYLGMTLIAIVIPVLFISGGTDNVTYKEDAIIVLGAAVRGERISGALQKRLDVAIEYYQENPDVVIVVTGGQGPQEDITEALAMERYLIANGIPQKNIIKEEKATSTYENFKYSKELLNDYFTELGVTEYKLAYVTDDYHIYRAGQLAKIAGLGDMTHCHSNTHKSIILPSGLRECMAIVKLWIFKQ